MTAENQRLFAKKHPKAITPPLEAFLSGPLPPDPHSIVFEAIDGDLIKKCALKTEGAAGVSQLDDQTWHKMVSSFKKTSLALCNAVAHLTRKLAGGFVDPTGLEALLANRGIPLDKNPGLGFLEEAGWGKKDS